MAILPDRVRASAAAAPSRSLRYVPATAFLLDLGIVAAACLLAAVGRDRLPIFRTQTDVSSNAVPVAPLVVGCMVLMLWIFGAYRREMFGVGTDEYRRVIHAGMYAAGLLGVTCYLTRYYPPRGFFVLAFVIGIPGVLAGRAGLRRLLHRRRTQGVLQERVLIVGGPKHVDEIAAVLRRERWLGYNIAGAIVPSAYAASETPGGVPVLAKADDVSALPEWCTDADVLFMTGGFPYSSTQLRQLVWDLEPYSVRLVVAPALTDISGDRVHVRPVGGLPLVHLEGPRWAYASRWAKRTFDIVGSSLLLILLVPVFLAAALWIKAHDGGPVLFRQVRVGRGGIDFACLKLRTMVIDAEHRLADLHQANGHVHGLFKLKDDPRVTRPGRFLRRFSIDELPQLTNVLRGDMSLVGPRPPLPHEVAHYDELTARRLRVRPGMTGLWQVSGRSDLPWEEAVRLDLYYVDNWSMLQDLVILARTAGAVLGRRGAY